MSGSRDPKTALQPRMPDAPRLVNVLATPKRIRTWLGDRLIADSRHALTLRANHFLPVYYFPPDDVDQTALRPTDYPVEQPDLGRAQLVWDVVIDDDRRDAVAWSYTTPPDSVSALAGAIAFDFKRMSRWMEEGEPVLVHPRDPYARVDVLDGDRLIEVMVRGRTVAQSSRTRLLIETHLPVRYYIPKADIDMTLFKPSPLRTRCPYKGEASYWNATIDDVMIENIAWSYEDPLPEVSRIGGLLCFYNDRVDMITRDGDCLSSFGV